MNKLLLLKYFKMLSVNHLWRETSQSPGTLIVDQPTNQQSKNDRRTADELKYSRHSARRCQCPTNNLLEVWQNLAIFGGRPISGAVEVLLTKVINRQLSFLSIVVFFVAPCRALLLA
jgi:hypothetical protein